MEENYQVYNLRNTYHIPALVIVYYLCSTQDTYRKYEENSGNMPGDYFAKLCKLYGVSLSYIFGWTHEKLPLTEKEVKAKLIKEYALYHDKTNHDKENRKIKQKDINDDTDDHNITAEESNQ